jgi:PKD repeat protein
MARQLRLNLPFLFAVALSSLWNGEAFGQQDCFDAINVCTDSYVQNTSYTGVGLEYEVPAGTSCLGNGEVNSVWYTFTATSSGNLLFQLNPLSPGDDYDFALFNLSTDSCSGIALGTSQPISCNYSADPGSTGLSSGGSGNNNGSSGPNQNAPVPVQQGETFALLISNFTASQSGYELAFSGSGSIVDNSAGVIDSISLYGQCNPNRVRLYLSDVIDCSSIASNGSDFSISGPGNVSIASANGISCSGGATELWLNFDDNLPQTGTYTVSVNTGTDGNTLMDGCGNEMATSVSVQFQVMFIGPEVTISNVVSSDCGLDNGSATANVTSGSPPYTFNWNSSPSQNTATAVDLEPRVYRVEVTDTNGCRAREFVTIDNNNPLDVSNVSATPVSCNGASDGTAQIIPSGGTGGFTIEWDTNPVQTGQNATNLPGGNIDVLVTDNSGCEEEVTINIPQPPQINIPITSVNPDCNVANGSATVNASGGNGGFSYQWNTNPVQTTSQASGLLAGVYEVVVTDMNGCTRTGSVILSDNFAPNATIESSVPDCGQGTGQATAVADPGTGPYTYQWNTSPPQSTATATGLSEGDYFVTITDANGCVQIINVKIDTVTPPQISFDLTDPGCGMSDGEATANVSYGISPYTYSWSSSGNTTSTETDLPEGTYSLTVVDSSGCTTTESFELNQLAPESEIFLEDVCFGEETSFSFTTTSGSTSWLWDFGDGNTSADANPVHTYAADGEFEVTLTLNGGCQPDEVIDTANVFEPPVADFTIDPVLPTTRDIVTFLYSGNGGTTFDWNLGDGTSSQDSRPSHQYVEDGYYDVLLTVTDANGCEDTITQTIEILLQPAIYVPNAFIPEGSPENSRFKGYGIGVTAAELSVFNRWGSQVFYSNDVNEILLNGWDGKNNGKLVPQGVYAYKLKASFYDGSEFQKLGTVLLIR